MGEVRLPPPRRNGRADVVWAAWHRLWRDNAHYRLRGDRSEPYVPDVALLDDLDADEARFLLDMQAGRMQGSVTALLRERFGRPTPGSDADPYPHRPVAPVVDLSDARLRRGPPDW